MLGSSSIELVGAARKEGGEGGNGNLKTIQQIIRSCYFDASKIGKCDIPCGFISTTRFFFCGARQGRTGGGGGKGERRQNVLPACSTRTRNCSTIQTKSSEADKSKNTWIHTLVVLLVLVP